MGRWLFCMALIVLVTPAVRSGAVDPDASWKALSFLEGTWDAKVQAGSAGAQGLGTYTFRSELNGHVLARHSEQAACRGPKAYDCEHSDLLYIYREGADPVLRALYLDSEGHVIHYAVTVPQPGTAEFNTDLNELGPQFHLVYHLNNGVMSGKFQMRLPGQADWQSYLEWSGARH